jgi:hypothetical protein
LELLDPLAKGDCIPSPPSTLSTPKQPSLVIVKKEPIASPAKKEPVASPTKKAPKTNVQSPSKSLGKPQTVKKFKFAEPVTPSSPDGWLSRRNSETWETPSKVVPSAAASPKKEQVRVSKYFFDINTTATASSPSTSAASITSTAPAVISPPTISASSLKRKVAESELSKEEAVQKTVAFQDGNSHGSSGSSDLLFDLQPIHKPSMESPSSSIQTPLSSWTSKRKEVELKATPAPVPPSPQDKR